MPLTDKEVRSAQPSEKAYRLYDARGLYLEVHPSGGKWLRLKYRFAGKEKRLSLGVYPEVSLKKARENRDECRRDMANGVDPGENRKAMKSARTDRAANKIGRAHV